MAMDLAELNCLQYPLTGRTSCNDRIEAANECRTDFAVPSDGSNLRQHGRSPMLAYISQTCSTLKRVEPQATPMRLSSFCDSAFLQYPQTGRTSGNQPNLTNNLFANWSCSTLRRVEPQATPNA